MEETTRENAVNDHLREMQDIVERVKRDKEVSLQYMKIFEREKMLVQEGEERGFERGIEQGLEQGVREFILDNLEEGVSKERIQEKLVRRFQLTEEQANDYLVKYASSEAPI